ncbi:hypothetical protein [Helicobacter canis]|uniref:D-lactate dehydrogenase n=1 Tax=Helicobacter canis TaxID=29419 RepID=A0A377J1A8_9HELI|nr:hypothetical protein [Helicobacter canis]STO96257.1 D-lactate dehydrogenase [Helicobacter canis]
MKKHKQHLIDHNTLESTAQKVDSSTAAMDHHADKSARDDNPQQSLRGSEATEAIHTNADSSVKVDRHADKSARDDRENADSTPTPSTKAEGFCDDFASFQGAGAGILLGVNEQARAVESSKSAQKPTPKPRKAESQAILCACSEFVYLGSLPYTLRLPTGKTYPLHQGDSFIVPQGDLSRYLEYKSTMFKKLR